MMSCEDFLAELGNYLENDTTAEVCRQLQNHLTHCRTCQILYDSVRKTLQVVTNSGCFDLPDTTAQIITETVMLRIRGNARS